MLLCDLYVHLRGPTLTHSRTPQGLGRTMDMCDVIRVRALVTPSALPHLGVYISALTYRGSRGWLVLTTHRCVGRYWGDGLECRELETKGGVICKRKTHRLMTDQTPPPAPGRDRGQSRRRWRDEHTFTATLNVQPTASRPLPLKGAARVTQ